MADYEKSYQQVKHKGIIPASSLAGAGTMSLRGPSTEKDAGVDVKAERTRETSDLLLRMNQYRTIDSGNPKSGARIAVESIHFKLKKTAISFF